ncbi:MAG: RNase adapter RapZ, partial [Actinomycetota bacterium]
NPVKAVADLLIDTTGLSVHQLRKQLLQLFGPENPGDALQVSLISFGFKHGVPLDVDMVFDMRFLPNPHWVEDLRPLSGLDEQVKDFVLQQDLAMEFLDHLESLLQLIVPAYVTEGRSYLTLGIGCTGGRHRSVAMTEELSRRLLSHGHHPRISHRDINL